jgi:hypothetical protein
MDSSLDREDVIVGKYVVKGGPCREDTDELEGGCFHGPSRVTGIFSDGAYWVVNADGNGRRITQDSIK